MLTSLNTGVSGMQAAQERINVTGNNIANVNTTGFKASRMTFADTFSETLRAGSTDNPSMQIGSGVSIGQTARYYSQGQKTETSLNTDLYIAGSGFFSVKTGDGAEYLSRDGEFRIDGSGYLVNNSGMRVQGYSDGGKTTLGDIKIDTTGKPATSAVGAEISRVDFRNNGEIWVTLTDQKAFLRGQVLLTNVTNPQALNAEAGNLYSNIEGAGRLAPAAPNAAGLGAIQSGYLELSNVDIAREFTDLITSQRMFQANAKMITTSDELLQEMVNLKR
jgi:flagellar hook protein FlgE